MTGLVSFSLWALNQSQLKNLTTYGAFVPMSAIVRSIVLIIAIVLGGMIYYQRSEISDCVDKAKDTSEIDCSFYGYDFTFSL